LKKGSKKPLLLRRDRFARLAFIARAANRQSFLVLFFKKEHSFFFAAAAASERHPALRWRSHAQLLVGQFVSV
jgi:hypothetical protein